MIQTRTSSRRAAAVVLALAVLAGCAGPGIGLDALPMEGANLAGGADPRAIRQAPFWDAVADIAQRQSAGLGESALERLSFIPKVLQETELTAEDLLEIRLAGRVDREGGEVVIGFRFARPLTPDALEAAIRRLAEEYDEPVEITGEQHAGGDLLQISPATERGVGAAWVGFAPDHTVVFQGGEAAVRGVLDRLDSGNPAPLTPELVEVAGSVDPAAQGWLAVAVTPDQREDMIALFGSDDVPAPLQGLVDGLATFTATSSEIRVDDAFRIRMKWLFPRPEQAGRFQENLTGLTELLRGLVALASGGRPLDAVNEMSLNREERVVTLDLAVSQDDLLTLEELYELNLTE